MSEENQVNEMLDKAKDLGNKAKELGKETLDSLKEDPKGTIKSLKKKPKVLAGIAAVVVVLVLLATRGGDSDGSGAESAGGKSSAKANPASDFSYDLNKDGTGIVIKGYTGERLNVVIPDKIEDYPVTEIAKDAFNKIFDISRGTKSQIDSIVFPKTLKKIGDSAFWQSSLKSVTIPSSVDLTDNSDSCFAWCQQLESVTIEKGVEYIPPTTFSNCIALKSISIPASVKKIDSKAFSVCNSLQKVSIPSSSALEIIDYEAFRECAITEISIPASVKKIDLYAFAECSSLLDVEFGSNDTAVIEDAFFKCPKLTIKSRKEIENRTKLIELN